MTKACFIKLNGIVGESQDASHQGEIDVLLWRWGMRYPSNADGGRLTVNALLFEHYTDKSSPALLRYCTTGKPLSEALLTLRKRGATPLVYMQIQLQDIIVTRVDTVCYSTMRAPREKVALSFSRFNVNYMLQNSAGSPAGTVSVGYDLRPEKRSKDA